MIFDSGHVVIQNGGNCPRSSSCDQKFFFICEPALPKSKFKLRMYLSAYVALASCMTIRAKKAWLSDFHPVEGCVPHNARAFTCIWEHNFKKIVSAHVAGFFNPS